MNWCLWFSGLVDAGPNDRMYNCLPMYHSVGGVVAVWAILLAGGSVVVPANAFRALVFGATSSPSIALFSNISGNYAATS